MIHLSSRNTIKIWLLLGFVEGLAALVLLLRKPSVSSGSVLLGYSAGRLALAGLVLLLVLLLGMMIRAAFRGRGVFRGCADALPRFIEDNRNLTRLAAALGYVFLLAAGSLLLSQLQLSGLSPDNMTNLDAARALSLWQALYQHAAPVLLWIGLLTGQGLVGLLLVRSEFLPAFRTQWRAGLDTLLLLLILTLIVFYWLLLILGINLFSLLPGWHWEFRRPQVIRPWLAALQLVLWFLAAWLAQRLYLRKRRAAALTLLLLAGVGYQLSFALFSLQGLDSLSAPYANSGHAVYARQAAQDWPVSEIIRRYESDFAAEYYFAMTKPPGVILFYAWMERLAGWIHPVAGEAARLENLLRFITILYPLLTMLPVLLLYKLGRMLSLKEEHALLPPIFYLCIPGVILMQLFLDQALYPTLFLAGALLAVQLCRRPTGWLALGLGIYLFTALFFSFTMLALVPFVVLLVGFFLLSRRRKPPLLQVAKMGLLVIAGAGLAYLLFRYAFGYDFFTRLQNAVLSHSAVSYGTRGESGITRWSALLVNNTEMAMWMGVPLFLLFLWEGVRASWRFLQHRAERIDLFNAAAFITYLALNLQGGTYAEVGRLWIFLAPLLAMAAAGKVLRLFAWERTGMLLVMALQLVTISLIFLFQGYNP